MACIRQALPVSWRHLEFQLDIATQDPRNIDPLILGESPLPIYDPVTAEMRVELLGGLLESIPPNRVQYCIYTTDATSEQLLAPAYDAAFVPLTTTG